MSEDVSKNLSETLFVKHKQAKETSALTQYMPTSKKILDEREAQGDRAWYRHLRRLQWAWQGLSPIEMEGVLSKIASSSHSRTNDDWLDTVMGYHSGNWTFEWIKLGMDHQKRANEMQGEEAADELFTASLCFSIAGYPHLKNDNLASQAQVLANKAYSDGAEKTKYTIKQIEVPYQNRKIIANLHLPRTDKQLPVVMVSAGLDTLQTDMWRLFRNRLAPRDIAMLTVDMPSVGHSSHWPLTENSSCYIKRYMSFTRYLGLIITKWGLGFVLVVMHDQTLFCRAGKDQSLCRSRRTRTYFYFPPKKLQKMPKMYLDLLASRLGKNAVDINSMAGQMMAWSLKVQGFLSSRKTKVPILALSLEGDPVSPHSDNQLVALFSQYGRAKKISSKTITKGYEQSLDLAIKWLEDELLG
ncbi:LOW QUALITY PROTEIN: fermentation/respiration switch protein [Vibrio sp. JCM 18904]|nr:LOW QUALITY PROTEIN: fermentation/respiration switch protein [Vibrio sp. JCM 18904]